MKLKYQPPTPLKSQAEKDEAFIRAKSQVNDNYKRTNLGHKPFYVKNSDKIIELIENGYSPSEITDFIYDTKGKIPIDNYYYRNKEKWAEYKKQQNGEKEEK